MTLVLCEPISRSIDALPSKPTRQRPAGSQHLPPHRSPATESVRGSIGAQHDAAKKHLEEAVPS